MKIKIFFLTISTLSFVLYFPSIGSIDAIDKERQRATVIEGRSGRLLSGAFSVLIWNVAKRSQQELTTLEFYDDSDIKILQECVQNDSSTVFAPGYRGFHTTGVAIVSPYKLLQAKTELHFEPILRTPKATLFATYPLENNQTLLIVNLHGVNFSWHYQNWQAQIESAIAAIKLHQGPVIMAGDFNTWRKARRDYLLSMTRSVGLTAHIPVPDNRTSPFGYALDWVFTRGLTAQDIKVYPSNLSDHHAMKLTLSLAQ